MTDSNQGWSDTQKIIALCIVGSFILIVILWMFFPPKGDPGAIAVLNTLVGTLGGGFGAIIMFFFGSSKGSTEKDTTIKEMVAATGTGNGEAMKAAVAAAALAAPAAAAVAAPAAAAVAAPPAADIAAPPVVNEVVPPAVEKAVADAMAAHDEVEKQK